MCRLCRYESNAPLTGQIGVKTEILWPIEGSGNFVNRWNLIFEFKINKIKFWIYRRTADTILSKGRDSLEKLQGRRVRILRN